MRISKLYTLMVLGALGIPWTSGRLNAAEPIPYFNPGEDLSTIEGVNEGTSSNYIWHLYTLSNPNKVFRIKPSSTSTTYVGKGAIFTKELDFKADKSYEISVDVAAWAARDQSKAIIMLSKSVETDPAEKVVLHEIAPVPAKTSTALTTYKAYYSPTADTPWRVGVRNAGGGNISWFMVDNFRVREIDEMMPSAATGLTAAAEGKTVTVSFTTPTLSVVGKPLASLAKVCVLRDGRALTTLENQPPGAAISVKDNLSTLGTYKYSVVCYYGQVEGQLAETSVTAGDISQITPTFNSNYQYKLERDESGYIKKDDEGFEVRFGANYMCRATYTPGTGIVVDWEPYASAPDTVQVKYKVVRVQDGKILADSTADLRVTDAEALSADRAMYTYKVTALYAGNVKDAYVSQTVSLHNPVPFRVTPSMEGFYEFGNYDEDHDMSKWAYGTTGSNAAKFKTPVQFSTRTAKQYLVFPGIDLKGGSTYRLDLGAFSSNIIEKMVGLDIRVGTANNPAGQTVKIDSVSLSHMDTRDYSFYYTPAQDGQYFLSVVARCPNERAGFDNAGLSHIDLYEVPSTTPAAVDKISVAYSNTPGEAVISFRAPAKDVSGNDLAALAKIEILRNGEHFKTIDNPAPGSDITVPVTVEVGVHSLYATVPYTAAGPGLATSATVMITQPPYENYFDQESDLTGFTSINPGDNSKTWSYMPLQKAVRSYPSSGIDQNAYFVTPPIQLEGGYFYKLSFLNWMVGDIYKQDNKLEVLVGTSPDIESMKKVVIAPFNVVGDNNSKVLIQEWFSMPETGQYYLAWHHTAPNGSAKEVYIDDIKISDKIVSTAPNGVTDLAIVPDPEGAMKGTVSFKLPTVDLAGNAIPGNIYRYTLYRDGKSVKSEYTKAPGTEITFEDGLVTSNPLTDGLHLYTVACESANTVVGREISDIAKFGIDLPGTCTDFSAVEDTLSYGTVKFTWERPTLDYEGFPLNTTKVTYTIGRLLVAQVTQEIYEDVFATGLDSCSLVYQVKKEDDPQEFCRFFLRATTSKGDARKTLTLPYIATGKPYEMPISESFSQMTTSISVVSQRTTDVPAQWGYNSVNPVTGVAPVDDDGGQAIMETMFSGGGNRLLTAKILIDTIRPNLSFWVYNQSKEALRDTNELAIEMRVGNGSFVDVANKTIDAWAGGKPGWQKASVDLSAYAGKVVYLGFRGLANNFTFIHMDAVRLASSAARDLTVSAFSHEKPYVGMEHKLTATVENHGIETATGARATLLLDNVAVKTVDIPSIAPGASAELELSNVLDRTHVGRHTYSLRVDIEGDADTVGNRRAAARFLLADNDFPRVMALEGFPHHDRVSLQWAKPEIPESPVEITDDLESLEAWSTMATGIGEYTLYDRDGGQVGGFQNVTMPNVPMYSKQSWYIFDASMEPFPSDSENRYRAYSGKHMLASMYLVNRETPVDDVIVSPRLSGKAQTIKFMARALSSQYPESFSVMYSTTTPDLKALDHAFPMQTNVGGEWTQYTYELPEGARYFAIRHYCASGYFLFVDDLTYTPEGAETLTHLGYNVYRDGQKQNHDLVSEPAWEDRNPVKSAMNYGVSAVYDRGESPLATVTAIYTGVEGIYGNEVSVETGSGIIRVSGAEGLDVTVMNAAGMVATTQRATDSALEIRVPAGVYIVRVGTLSAKVAVK